MKYLPWIAASALLLAACSSSVPDSGVVTLEPMTADARNARNLELQGAAVVPTGTSGAAAQTAITTTPSAGLSNDTSFTGGAVAAAPLPVGNAENYEVIAPKPLPARPANTGPSVVGYALETNHSIGEQVYTRNAASAERSARACERYASADLAQAAFLAAGGPQQDSRSLDPDGDGYACTWDPAPFRKAIQ